MGWGWVAGAVGALTGIGLLARRARARAGEAYNAPAAPRAVVAPVSASSSPPAPPAAPVVNATGPASATTPTGIVANATSGVDMRTPRNTIEVWSPQGGWVYRTPPEFAVEAAPRIETPIGYVTSVPLLDRRTGLFARPTYRDARSIAREMGAELLSDDDENALAQLGLMLDPCTLDPSFQMASMQWAIDEDRCIAQQLAAANYGTLVVNNAGKDWLSGASPGKARNSGWYSSGMVNGKFLGARPPAGKRIQPPSQAHDDGHTDYSQLLRLIWRH